VTGGKKVQEGKKSGGENDGEKKVRTPSASVSLAVGTKKSAKATHQHQLVLSSQRRDHDYYIKGQVI